MKEKELQSNEHEITEKNKTENKITPKSAMPKLIICTVAVFALVFGIYFLFGNNSGAAMMHRDNLLIYDYQKQQYHGLSKGKISESAFQGDIEEGRQSLKSNASFLLNKSGILCKYENNDFLTISENVKDFKASSFGNAVAYTDKSTGSLNLYLTETKTGYAVAQNTNNDYLISPNGNYVTYTVSNQAGVLENFLFDGTESLKI